MAPAMRECEVAVYGGTPAGVTAAIEAARLGRKTLLLSFNRHVGGMTSGGLTATDVGKKESIGGLAMDFYTRIGRISGFSPSAAGSLYRKLLDEAGVTVLVERPLESVHMRQNRILSITMSSTILWTNTVPEPARFARSAIGLPLLVLRRSPRSRTRNNRRDLLRDTRRTESRIP